MGGEYFWPCTGEYRDPRQKITFDEKLHRVYINKSQYFSNMETYIWEFHIGTFQICHKWLKDRIGRNLSDEEIETYCKIVTAIEKTIEIQKEIDKIYPEVEKDLIDFSGM